MSRLKAHSAWLPAAIVGGLAAMMLVVAGCGGSSSSSDNGTAQKTVGAGEGQLNLVAWPGYVADPWKSDFEKQTGCQIKLKEAGTSDEMVDLMRTGQWDGVSASGNATAKLVDGGDVAPVNTDLVPNYATIFGDLKNQPYNTFDGKPYGIPHGRGANLLMSNSNDVKPNPTSWSAILDPAQAAKYKGKISVYDDPIYIADAAVYLKAHQPGLGITNPYELDDNQFNAAVDLLKQQHPNVGEYWSDAAKQINSFANGDDVIGTTWQYQYFALLADNQPMQAPGASTGFVPTEGSTGWSDTWMIAKNAAHPNCMYKWMNFITSPQAQAEVAQYFGEAPAQSKACAQNLVLAADKAIDYPADPKFCDEYHAADPNFWKKVYYWQVPLADCGDNRGDTCKDYNDWSAAWTQIKG